MMFLSFYFFTLLPFIFYLVNPNESTLNFSAPPFFSSLAHDIIVAPVVTTSSIISICFPSRGLLFLRINTSFTLSFLCHRFKCVWLAEKDFLFTAFFITGKWVISLTPRAISMLWLYPRDNCRFLASGIGNIASMPLKKPSGMNSSATIRPICSPTSGCPRYLSE